jgi:PKHD-type hydroxylase
MITNDKFQFVIHRNNFLLEEQCVKLIRYFESNKYRNSELAGTYDKNLLNKEVRNTKELVIDDEKLTNKLKMVFELANVTTYNYDIEEMEEVKLLKYTSGGKYKWHTDCGAKEISTRKLSVIVQLSDEDSYEGGDLEFGITNETGESNYTARRTRGSIIIFPAFLSHRITPITHGIRYSLITWMNGDTWI